MDTSFKYIAMCLDSEKIVTGHIWEEGDYYCNLDNCEIGIVKDATKIRINHVWLPKQDQLQCLATQQERSNEPKSFCGFYLYCDFCKWLLHHVDESNQNPFYFYSEINHNSMEQIWLSYVMYKCYKKTWNGKEWKTVRED